ncbi:MAG: VPLPA-CTERM sorting domain-containing protein [Phycisphaeraceae bacterium]|nr:VPLPA-CTERM sorting domain-containing protein [Phycisphaeraceae bacterium]
MFTKGNRGVGASMSRGRSARGWILAGWVLAAAAAWAGGVHAATITKGTLSASKGTSILDSDLAKWIDDYIPGGSQRLIVMTQCYGGDTAKAFTGKANTAVASATSAGEKATYGGYDKSAADALKPGAGKTASDVHTAGTGGKASGETPSSNGGLGLGDFKLDPTDANSSRHVLVYAGKPDGGGGTSDTAQRDKIKGNFAGQTNTTITTAGGSTAGSGGWDQEGSAAGLKKALKQIGDAINASADPSKEQFILFITDHGDTHQVDIPLNPVITPGGSALVQNFQTFQTTATFGTAQFTEDANNVPGFSVFLDLHAMGLEHPIVDGPLFAPGDWELVLTPNGGSATLLDSFFDVFTELSIDDSGIVGDEQGEGVQLFFPVSEPVMISSFFDVFVEIEVVNHTADDWTIGYVSQDSGDMAKIVPEPAGLWLLGAAIGWVGSARRVRRA